MGEHIDHGGKYMKYDIRGCILYKPNILTLWFHALLRVRIYEFYLSKINAKFENTLLVACLSGVLIGTVLYSGFGLSWIVLSNFLKSFYPQIFPVPFSLAV